LKPKSTVQANEQQKSTIKKIEFELEAIVSQYKTHNKTDQEAEK